MTNYIPIVALSILVIVIYKLLTKYSTSKIEDSTPKIEDPFDGPIQRKSKAFHDADNFDMNLAHDAYKERELIITGGFINDHIAEIMNIKKKK
jgi:hypothetical protein